MKTIVWDIDDVLNNLMEQWFYEKWLREHSDFKLSYSDLTENPPHKILGITIEEYQESLDEFRLTSYMNLKPNSEVIDWFNNYGSSFRHIVLTSTPLHTSPIVANWVYTYFCRWIRTIHVIPSYRSYDNSPVYESNKGEFFDWFLPVDLVIDDSITNVNFVTKKGVKAILWPQPWNKIKRSVSETLLLINKILMEHQDESIRLCN
ncbi:hypothetical protein [Thermodesulfovibrio hydrogeniphilus]